MRTELQVCGGKHPDTLVVEPWAEEFVINPGDQCRAIAVRDSESSSFGIAHRPEYLVVSINWGGATLEFWRGGKREA